MKTLIVIIMDESGSMSSKKSDVIGGFNEFITGQKEITADTASVIFVKFNTTVTVVHDAKAIDEAVELSPMTYRPAGQTALFDAIWDGVRLGEKKEADFDRVICLIMTDGEENASRKITSTGIRNLLKIKEDEGKWTFLYIGENPERWATQTGISTGNVAQYNHVAPRQNFHSTIQAVSLFRNETMQQQQQLMQRVQQMPMSLSPMSAMPIPQTGLYAPIAPQLDDSWREQNFRQNMVAKIEEAITQNGTPTATSIKPAKEMENEIFLKVSNKAEYHRLLAQLIIRIKEQGKFERESMMRAQSNLVAQLNNQMFPPAATTGIGLHSMMYQQNNGVNVQQGQIHGHPGTIMSAAEGAGVTRPQTPPPPYSEVEKK